jgi:hypothetical protein
MQCVNAPRIGGEPPTVQVGQSGWTSALLMHKKMAGTKGSGQV